MLNLEFLKSLLLISMTLGTITCSLVQKTKKIFQSSKYLCLYSFFVNMSVGIVFCITFTNINFPNSLWIGLFSFIGADTLYKLLEGKLPSYTDIISKDSVTISKENIINEEEDI